MPQKAAVTIMNGNIIRVPTKWVNVPAEVDDY